MITVWDEQPIIRQVTAEEVKQMVEDAIMELAALIAGAPQPPTEEGGGK